MCDHIAHDHVGHQEYGLMLCAGVISEATPSAEGGVRGRGGPRSGHGGCGVASDSRWRRHERWLPDARAQGSRRKIRNRHRRRASRGQRVLEEADAGSKGFQLEFVTMAVHAPQHGGRCN